MPVSVAMIQAGSVVDKPTDGRYVPIAGRVDQWGELIRVGDIDLRLVALYEIQGLGIRIGCDAVKDCGVSSVAEVGVGQFASLAYLLQNIGSVIDEAGAYGLFD